MRKFHEVKYGVHSFFDGMIEYDPEWRSRSVLVQLEGQREPVTLTRADFLASMPCETAIEYIGGLPGGGKSMYAVKLVLDELMFGHRPIVTNLALKLGRIQEYLHEMGFAVHVARRVFLLDSPQAIRQFYLRRTHDLLLPMPTYSAQGKQVSWDSSMDWLPSQEDDQAAGGVFYVIDEAHNYFHPDAFQLPKMTPEHPLFQWASQHRKLKDICYFVTQSVENVHVSVRRLGAQFHYIRNYRKETYRGFRRGDGFVRTTYLKQPTSESAVPIEEKTFRLDVKGICSCYYTAGGVGISAKGVADGGSKKKGMSMKWLWAGAAACILGLCFVLFVLPRLVLHGVVNSTVGASVKAAAATGNTVVSPVRSDSTPRALAEQGTRLAASVAALPQEPRPAPAPLVVPTRVYVTSITGSRARGRFTINLSDGRTYTEEDGAVTYIGRNYVVAAGVRYQMIQGSGAERAPVRRDGVPPVAVVADVPVARQPGEETLPGPAAVANKPNAPLQQNPSSDAWVMGDDGVRRLRVPSADENPSKVTYVPIPRKR